MTSSEIDRRAEALLNELLSLLSGRRIAREIDEPIDRAARSFRLAVTLPLSHAGFNRLVAGFLRHLYRKGVRLPLALTEKEAFGEAVSVLARLFAGPESEDYDSALLDAGGETLEGLETLLSRIAERVKEIEREKYLGWVLASRCDPSDWEMRLRLAAVYLKRFGGLLPPSLFQMAPARLAYEVEHLIISRLPADELIDQVLARSA